MRPELIRELITGEDLARLQKIQLDMLVEVDRICRKNNIPYALYGGTMLGAIRHTGFIPWDDDIDIAMLRKDYDVFREVCQRELNTEKYYFQDNQLTPHYRWGFSRVRRKDTLFMRTGHEGLKPESGVFLDIFPQDCVPDNAFTRWWHAKACIVVRKLQWAPVGKRTLKNPIARGFFSLVSHFPEKWIIGLHKALIRASAKPHQCVRSLTMRLPRGREYGGLRVWYENLSEYEFEGHMFFGVTEYDAYLTHYFGDYMQLPPEDKRHGHHYVSDYDLGDFEI